MILLHCPDCAAKIRAPDQILGRQVRCPKCNTHFTAAPNEAAPPEPEVVSEPEPAPGPEPPPPDLVAEITEPPSPMPEKVPRSTAVPVDTAEEEPKLSANEPVYDPMHSPPNPVADILLFRTMIAPVIIQVGFWVGVILCILLGVVYLIAAIGLLVDGTQPASSALLQGLGALSIMVFGPPVVRIGCELLMVCFRIYDTLREMQATSEKRRWME